MKVIALDLDGTLLDKKKRISAPNLKRLQELREQGVKIVLASGRSASAMRLYYNQLGLDEPIVCCNGALVMEPKTGNIIASHEIEKDDLDRAVAILEEEKAYYLAYTDLTLWLPSVKFTMKKWIERNRKLAPEDQVNIQIRADFKTLFEEELIYKLLIFCADEGEKKRRFKKLRQLKGLEVIDSMPGAIDVMHHGVTKADGLKVIADYYGITMEEIVFMGDHNNDVEALKQAGVGIAMGNATDAARKAADWQTADHEEDGVKLALDRLFAF
jgi:hypothetical protein